jgi:hypothetical protein
LKIRIDHLNFEGENFMKLKIAAILCAATLTAISAYAQTKAPPAAAPAKSSAAPAAAKSVDTNLQILIDKVKADKKLLVAANMNLTDAEGKGFWPVYDAYQKDLKLLNDRTKAAIMAYADAYNKNTLTDEQATKLTNDVLTIDQDEVAMRKKYATMLAPVLNGKKAARYLQIENKIRAALKYEMADAIPLVE